MKKELSKIIDESTICAIADLEMRGEIPLSTNEIERMTKSIRGAIEREIWRTNWWKKECKKKG